MTTHRNARPRLFAVGAIFMILLGLAACASDSKRASVTQDLAVTPVPGKTASGVAESKPVGGPPVNGATGQGVALADNPGQSPGQVTGPLPTSAPLGDALAITAAVTVEVADVRKAVIGLPALVDAKGGAIYNTDIQVGDPKTASAIVTIKVPPADLERMISGLGGIGVLVSRAQQTEDVSTQITDVSVRIATAQASVERIRALLKEAKSLQEVTSIESELTNRETTLEQLLAQQRNLSGRVQLATLTVTLIPTSDKVVTEAGAKPQTVGGAWHDGWRRFTKIVHGFGVALAYAVPFAVLIALAGSVGWMIRRRTARRGPKTNTDQAVHTSTPTISEAGV